MTSLTRRMVLKFLGSCPGLRFLAASAEQSVAAETSASNEVQFESPWHRTHNRVWIGGQYWANPMEDWCIRSGGAECTSRGGNRNLHLLTHQIANPDASFSMSVRVQGIERGNRGPTAGFRIGICSDINEYKSNCFARGGINCGVDGDTLVIGNKAMEVDLPSDHEVLLELRGRPSGERYELTLRASTSDGKFHGEVTAEISPDDVLGNVAIVNNLHPKTKRQQGWRFRFYDWRVAGEAFHVNRDHAFGPLLWTMYSLNDSRSDDGFVLKLMVLTGPLGENDNKRVVLQTQQDGNWQDVAESTLADDSWTAVFRIANWDASADHNFRVAYAETHIDGSTTQHHRTGTIKANPSGRPLRLGALTCQNDYAFPYEPVANNLLKLDPDMLYFSGDQIYEGHGGFGVIRKPAARATLNYLRKFYQFGWAFGDAMRDRPTICLPDDHDVFQGNIWGESGAEMGSQQAGAVGGYSIPPETVNVVHRTCAGHHPDPVDPEPVQRGISVYFGELVYGGVGFAILGDRQFKSSPHRVSTWPGRPDHVLDASIDTQKLDQHGLKLLGERQEQFLEKWSADWRGHTMKVLLSQTVFAAVATHHGSYGGYLRADLDSGGWPQTPRNRAIDILRQSKALHINGDQHLTTMVQYGVNRQRDSNWSFCTPAIAVGYPRWWRPDELGTEHENRPAHGLAHTGEYVDSFGNRVYVYAVGNPDKASKKNRYELAHQKGSGFGLVTIDPVAKTYHCEAYRFLVDATDAKADNQFPGWPLTIKQQENSGENLIG